MNHTQLLLLIPVSRYIQVITPIKGIREYFFIKAIRAKTKALIQNMINEIFGMAISINDLSPLVYSSLALKSKLKRSEK